jgi:hypothetical protein
MIQVCLPLVALRSDLMRRVVRLHLSSLILISCLALPTAGVAQCEATATRNAATTSATLLLGETYSFPFGEQFSFRLSPIKHGWRISIGEEGREEDLARLTPPWHFVPNPRYIEGWHFRNASNTGPNDGSVNAPQHVRQFIFSPVVDQSADYLGGATLAEVVDEVARFGNGSLEIRSYALTPPRAGESAAFVEMTFSVCLVWLKSQDAD